MKFVLVLLIAVGLTLATIEPPRPDVRALRADHCNICKEIIGYFEEFLYLGKGFLEELVEKKCLQGCDSPICKYLGVILDKIIELLEQKLTPEKVCSVIKLCS